MGKYDQVSPPSSQPEKESLFVNLMKHSERSYDSFQDELEDYIRVQKARGLEPQTRFRKMREDCLGTCGCREEPACRPRYKPLDPRPPPGSAQPAPRPCRTAHGGENRLPPRFPAQDGRPSAGSVSHSRRPQDCVLEKRAPSSLGQREDDCAYHVEPRAHGHLSSGSSPRARPASHGEARQRRKGRPEGERPAHRRKRGSEEADADGHGGTRGKRAKAGAAQASAEGLRGRKEKRAREAASKREARKHRKARKDLGKERAEEEMLWDQSILGF